MSAVGLLAQPFSLNDSAWMSLSVPKYSVFTDPTFFEILANASGSSTSTWVASKGNNATGTVDGYSATGLNGQPTFQITSTNSQFLITYPTAPTQPCTLWVVFKCDSAASGPFFFVSDQSDENMSAFSWQEYFQIYSGDYDSEYPYLRGPAADTSWHILEAQYNGASSLIRIDGGTPTNGIVGINNGTVSGTIGNDGAGYPLNGSMAFVGWQSGLPANDNVVGNCLANLYGLTW